MIGSAGAAFLALSQSVDNLVKYLFGPGAFWLVAGPLLAAAWSYEYFCMHNGEDDE